MSDTLLSEADFIAGFHAIGAERYHHKHPFHLLMHEGKLTKGQLQSWALNRYYYQSRIPIKDAAILGRTEDADFRRTWRKRIIDHDGDGTRPGGIEKWLRLVEATGLTREDAIRGEGILPATRYAVQAYVDFVSTRPFLEAVASSLTELFSGKLIALRIDALRKHYPWLSGGLDYFTGRLTQASEDADFALAWVVEHARTRQEQNKAHDALRAKCDILWAQLDALYFSYVSPGWPPPGAFKPQIPSVKANAMMPELSSRPRLAVGCRLNEKSQPSRVLHMPEKALRLNGPSLEIIERCDGNRTVREIISELQALYSKAEPQKVESDILDYLARLHDQRALDFTSDRVDRSADAK